MAARLTGKPRVTVHPKHDAAPVPPPSGPQTRAAQRTERRAAFNADEVAISADAIDKTYPNGTKAVRGIRFQVRRGEIYGLLGPNGAGKSTMIGILGTLVRPTAGAARVGGIDVTEDPMSVRASIGFAMQEAGVDDLATGREFLLLQGRLYGLGKAEAARRAEALFDLFDLQGAADKRIGSYSGGMKRRIDLAAALIHQPPFVFLDEPTEGLDPRGRRDLWDTLRRLRTDTGVTILLSTHYMEEADALCDRLAILSEGRIVAEGSPRELKAKVGGEAVVLEYADVAAEARERAARVVAGVAGVERVQPSASEIFVYVREAGQALPLLLAALDHAGLRPLRLRIQTPSLDDVYLRYTGRTMQQAEAVEVDP